MNRPNDPKPREIEALLPAFVLGALQPDEMHWVDAYISQQREFLTRLQKIEEQSALLTHITKPVAPPPNVRRTVLMIARLDAPDGSIPSTLPSPISTAIQSYGTHGSQNGNGVNGHNGHSNGQANGNGVVYAIAPYRPQEAASIRRVVPTVHITRQRRITLRLWQIAATTALLALLAVATVGLILNRQLNHALEQTSIGQDRITTLMATNNQLLVEKESLHSQNQQLSNEQQRLAQQMNVIASADRATPLRDIDSAGSAQAMLYKTRVGLVIAASGLAELSPDQTYQLWLIDTLGDTKPIAVFTVLPNESQVWREFSVATAQLNYNSVALSIEQLGGSATPSKIIMRSIR